MLILFRSPKTRSDQQISSDQEFIYSIDIIGYVDIPEYVLKEYLLPENYGKPKIEIGNYYLSWNDKSPGIPQKEVSELKTFLRNAITYFGIMFEVLNSVWKTKNFQKQQVPREFNPFVSILHHNKMRKISYDLYMAPDGSTFIDRLERIGISKVSGLTKDNGITENQARKSILHLKWTLGELLFNRQRTD